MAGTRPEDGHPRLRTGARCGAVGAGAARYELTARLDSALAVLDGRAVIHLPGPSSAGDTVRLDVGRGPGMRIHEVRDDRGRRLDPIESGRSAMAVAVAEGTGSVDVIYSVRTDGAGVRELGYLLLAEAVGAPWYPRLTGGDGKAASFSDFDVTLERPASWAVVTTGGAGEILERSGRRVRVRYTALHAEGFAIAAGEGFVVEERKTPGPRLLAFFHQAHAGSFRTVVERTEEAVAWYTRTYGFFPVETVAVVQGHPGYAGGFPLANMFMVHLGNLGDDFLSFITAHELGHYYWGLHVLGDTERLDWLVLGMGIWANQLYLAQRGGRSLEDQWRRGGNGDWVLDYLTAMLGNREQRLGLDREQERELGFDYNSLVRHGKGATGVFLQARLLGTDRFLDLQRRVLREYRHRPLPVDDFVSLLESEGSPGAAAFFEAWSRGDARIGVAPAVIADQGDGTRVLLVRTGPVPYPVQVEMQGAAGEVTRHTMAADVRTDTVEVAWPVSAVRLDPSGSVPMWNTSHPGMKSLFIQAYARESMDGAFLPLAARHLEDQPEDDRVRYLLTRRLFELGRWSESLVAAGTAASRTVGCVSRDACRTGIYAARALARLGRMAEAARWIQALKGGAAEHGLQRVWLRAREEIG